MKFNCVVGVDKATGQDYTGIAFVHLQEQEIQKCYDEIIEFWQKSIALSFSYNSFMPSVDIKRYEPEQSS